MTDGDDIARFIVPEPGDRIDRALVVNLGLGRRRAKALIDQGCVRVEGRRMRAGSVVAPGATIEVILSADTPAPCSKPGPRELPRVLWRGDSLVAVFKPVGFHSVRGRGSPCVADFVATETGGIDSTARFASDRGLVHRLDRDTCGIMLAATDETTYDTVRDAFARGAVEKEYLALVAGRMEAPCTVDTPLTRLRSRVRPARRGEAARIAVTTVEPLEVGPDWTLVTASMRTGVTHQIRAHLALAGFPVVGDTKYGDPSPRPESHKLHARRITLGDGPSLAAEPGVEFMETLAALRLRVRAMEAPGA